MYPRVNYLEWAIQNVGRTAFDLATSGMPAFSLSELGPPPDLDDARARPALVAAIAHHNGVTPDETIATIGAAHAIWIAYASLLAPGDELLVEEPAYEPLLTTARGIGAHVTRFPRPANADYAVDPELIAPRITERTRAVLITNLHNPSGRRTDDETLREVARLIGERGGHLIVNEIYSPFDDFVDKDGVFRGCARHLADNVVVVSSMTKCYGLGTHRFGWVLGPVDVIRRAYATMMSSAGYLPLPHAQLFIHALSHIQTLAARSRRLLADKRARASAWLAQEQPRFAWSGPQSGLFGLATLPGAGDLRLALEKGAAEHGALVVPGSFFEVPNGFRLSWSIDDPRLDEGLDRLGRILRSL